MHAFHNKQKSETKDQILVIILGLISLSCLAHQQKHQHRNSLVVQRLGFSASTAVAWVACIQSLVGELRYCKSCGVAETKQTNKEQQQETTSCGFTLWRRGAPPRNGHCKCFTTISFSQTFFLAYKEVYQKFSHNSVEWLYSLGQQDQTS